MKVLKAIVYPLKKLTQSTKHILENMFLDKYLKQFSINKIDAISGYEFEKYLEYLFRAMGYKSKATKKAHDYGADLLVTHKKETTVVQAKLYYNKNVSLSAVQEAKASLDYYVADKAVVITNSHFTKSAYELALSTGVALIDREKLITLIQADKKQKRILFERYIII